jgi:hypothetical protein
MPARPCAAGHQKIIFMLGYSATSLPKLYHHCGALNLALANQRA